VKDRDHDALLDRWEVDHGYADIQDGSLVSLPGSDPDVRDLFVQMDYLKAAASSGSPSHSHLLKLESINMVGQAFANRGIRLHVDAGSKYPPSEFVIGAGSGGNAIDESAIVCADSSTQLCQFPNLSGVMSWKGGVHEVKNKYFQHGRKDSYRYLLSGHSLGLAAKSWSIGKQSLLGISCCTVAQGKNLATVTTASAHGITRNQRVTVSGAISDWDLNGTYIVQSATPNSFTIATTGVTNGEYGRFPDQALGVSGNHYNEPNLAVSTGSVTSTSGFSDLGGGDHYMALGLWRADDPLNCQSDPSVPLNAEQKYCDDHVGSALVQAGTWAHEFGHLLLLTHGGFYPPQSDGGPPSFGANCKPNHVTSMNYLFQIRGIPGRHVDFSGQNLPALDEPTLVEANGLGRDVETQQLPQYGTRWYAPLGFLDTLLQNSFGGRIARTHCDGSPTSPGEAMVRIEAPTVAAGQVAALDWNNNGVLTDVVSNQDVNFNGVTNDTGFAGFNDWAAIDLQQSGARRNVAGFSVDVSGSDVLGGGSDVLGGGSDVLGGGSDLLGGGSDVLGGGSDLLGGGSDVLGGGVELNFEIANATVDAPTNLTGTPAVKSVVLNWSAPGFGLIRAYYVWRADITKHPMSATNPPKNIGTLKATGAPPSTTFTDANVKTNATYRYFVTAALGADSGVNSGNQSGPSNFADVLVK
jgi:hypothetical protein